MEEIPRAAQDVAARAFGHVNGQPESINIRIDHVEIAGTFPLLPVCDPVVLGHDMLPLLAARCGASLDVMALWHALQRLANQPPLRGAALLRTSGELILHGDARGVRVSHFGLEHGQRAQLAQQLATISDQPQRILEALLLTSKALAAPGVLAEICLSDDRGYPHGYFASALTGYVRLKALKGEQSGGGRVFLIDDATPLTVIIEWLEERPMLATTDFFRIDTV